MFYNRTLYEERGISTRYIGSFVLCMRTEKSWVFRSVFTIRYNLEDKVWFTHHSNNIFLILCPSYISSGSISADISEDFRCRHTIVLYFLLQNFITLIQCFSLYSYIE